MDCGLYVDDKEGLKITIDGEAFKDSTFLDGTESKIAHEHIRLIRDVTPGILGESVGTGQIELEPCTQYVISGTTNIEWS